MKPDPLTGMNARQRFEREREDAIYLMTHAQVHADPAGLAVVNRLVERGTPGADMVRPYEGKPMPIICVRLDLDHPLMMPDNKVAACADCDCDLQIRPESPAGETLCICCAACRERERRTHGPS